MINNHSAIIIKTIPFQEEGLIVSFITELGERLVGFAKAARRPSAKWVSNFELLSLVDLTILGKEQTDIKRITKCSLVSSPFVLGHLESNLIISCLADIFDRVVKEGVEDARLFRLLSACSRAITANPNKSMAILTYGEHWVLHCLGVLPHPKLCGYCGNDNKPLVEFNEEYGWRCSACTKVDTQFAFPLGVKEHLRLLRTCTAKDAPNPYDSKAATIITNILRNKIKSELGNINSYLVMEQLLALPSDKI